MNIVTWADSAEAAQTKIAIYFERFDWHIVEVAEATALDVDFVYESEEFQNMVDRARHNPDAIICGTFHSYKVN